MYNIPCETCHACMPADAAKIDPFRTAVPFRGQITLNLSGLSPKRDCGSEGVNPSKPNETNRPPHRTAPHHTTPHGQRFPFSRTKPFLPTKLPPPSTPPTTDRKQKHTYTPTTYVSTYEYNSSIEMFNTRSSLYTSNVA